jgi:lipoprotein signal peptidase
VTFSDVGRRFGRGIVDARTLLIVCAVTVLADQASKIWAINRLMYSCRTVGTPTGALVATRCGSSGVVVNVGGAGARSLALVDATASTEKPLWEVACASGESCMRGEVRVGDVPAGAVEKVRFAGDEFEPTRVFQVRAEMPEGAVTSRFMLHKANEQLRERIVVIPGFFDFTYVENPGAAWSLFRDPKWESFRTPFFHVISVLAVLFILYYHRRVAREDRVMRVVLGLVLGGAVGNYIDRLRFNYVVDFIDWYVDKSAHVAPCTGANHWPGCPAEMHWPTFNVADAAIVIGLVLLIVQSLRERRRAKAAAKSTGAATPA